jgi:hypothetical protein
MRSLPSAQRNRWIPIRLIGCVHTHQETPLIEGWGCTSHVRNAKEKNRENNQKVGKIGRTIRQMPTLGPKHDKI